MKELYSIRMRASKEKSAKGKGSSDKKNNSEHRTSNSEHISGAEGIYEESDINKTVRQFTERALKHPKGKPDIITLTVELLHRKPVSLTSLPVITLKCSSSVEAKAHILIILGRLGVSLKAIETAFSIISGKTAMQGASLISSKSGRRLEADKMRGIRASHMGIEKSSAGILSRKLSKGGINTHTVKEAVILASKVASCREAIAELCISDNPDYTTGYVASRRLGYIRIPHIKKKGSPAGGRAFFIKTNADIKHIYEYLQACPSIIRKTGGNKGIMSIDEILRVPDRKSRIKKNVNIKNNRHSGHTS